MKDFSSREHRQLVERIFSSIHERYDALNHVLSLGCDFYWRRYVAGRLLLLPGALVLDLACGTGDLALSLLRAQRSLSIVGADLSQPMLEIGVKKVIQRKASPNIRFVRADALKLPFSDNKFDAVVIAFGIRNISPMEGALKEIVRVLKVGSDAFILEMHDPPYFWLKLLFRLYCRTILKWAARVGSNNPSAYDYLINSIVQFPSPLKFKEIMGKVGFREIRQHALFPGITYLHVGRKIAG